MTEPTKPKPDKCRECNGTGIRTEDWPGPRVCACHDGEYLKAWERLYRQLGKSKKAKVRQ